MQKDPPTHTHAITDSHFSVHMQSSHKWIHEAVRMMGAWVSSVLHKALTLPCWAWAGG